MKIRRNSTFRKLPSITFANVLVVVVVTAAAVSISAVVAVVSYVFTYRIPQVALAQPQEQLKSSDGGAGLNLLSTKNATNSSELNTILGEPFFEDRGSKDTGNRVLSTTDPIQTEHSYIANITIKGVGNATDTGTFITTYEHGGITSIGHGIITSSDGEMATYTAKDLGVTNEKGERNYRGIQIFSTNSSGKLSFLNNLVGLYMYGDNPDGSRKSGKIWDWR